MQTTPKTTLKQRRLTSAVGVVFFHNQDLNAERLKTFVTHFGKPIPEPFIQSAMQPTEPVGESKWAGRNAPPPYGIRILLS